METDELIKARHQELEDFLDERQRRLHAAVEAKVLGHGGVKRVSEATGVARGSILAGIKELEAPQRAVLLSEPSRVRRAGAGRKKLVDLNPGVREALERLVEPVTRGDPQSPLRWTCKSLMQLARELGKQGHAISHVSVGVLLKDLGYSLQGNRKTLEGASHPDRNTQFEYINDKTQAALRAGQPVQQEQITALQEAVKQMQSRLNMSSRNSSKPPSSDGLNKPAPKSLRVAGEKPTRGQKGHPGSALCQATQPDKIVVHGVPDQCQACQRSLPFAFVGETRQVFDLPSLQFEVIEHHAMQAICSCGNVHTGEFPVVVNAGVQYGPPKPARGVGMLSSYYLLLLTCLKPQGRSQ